MFEFALECVKRGAIVSEPFGDDAPYDLIIDSRREKPFKVQVKTAWPKTGVAGVFIFNATRRVPTKSSLAGPSSTSIRYEPGEIDCIVTKAGGIWFFFDDPPSMPGTVEVRPGSGRDEYRWNAGKDKWSVVDLVAPSAPENRLDSA
jgi:PD-(D/E)XK nuclease superfamily protein